MHCYAMYHASDFSRAPRDIDVSFAIHPLAAVAGKGYITAELLQSGGKRAVAIAVISKKKDSDVFHARKSK